MRDRLGLTSHPGIKLSDSPWNSTAHEFCTTPLIVLESDSIATPLAFAPRNRVVHANIEPGNPLWKPFAYKLCLLQPFKLVWIALSHLPHCPLLPCERIRKACRVIHLCIQQSFHKPSDTLVPTSHISCHLAGCPRLIWRYLSKP